jgi:hypothetical protein
MKIATRVRRRKGTPGSSNPKDESPVNGRDASSPYRKQITFDKAERTLRKTEKAPGNTETAPGKKQSTLRSDKAAL